MVTAAFEKWALGFSGCDGGNPRGGIWICGIEWGVGHTEDNLKFEDVSSPPSLETWPQEELEQFLKYQYSWKAVTLLCAIEGKPVDAYTEFFQQERCFYSDSRYFKMNLYPLGFRDTSPTHWKDWLTRLTGLQNKNDYKQWCRNKRFQQLRNWVLHYNPKLIVCTGKGHRAEFFEAFGDDSEPVQHISCGAKDIAYIRTNREQTLVAVTYFLGGPSGLKSDEELLATGACLRTLVPSGSLNRDRAKLVSEAIRSRNDFELL